MKRILIVGSGFAGMYAALCAARLRDQQGASPEDLEIVVVAPEPRLVIRPRLYEAAPETMVAPLAEVFEAVDVRYEQGRVDVIDSAGKSATIVGADGMRRSLGYDRLVLAAGSQGFKPDIPGLAEYGFTVDQLEDAIALDHHMNALANRPSSAARDTVVVCGGGFTGIEVAAEMPSRLRAVLGPKGKRPRHHRRPQRSQRAGNGPASASADREGTTGARRGSKARRGRLGADRERRHLKRQAVHRKRHRDLGGRLPRASTHRTSTG